MLRFRIHGHTVVPKDFSGESWMQHFANEQAAYDHIMSIDLCEVCLAPPLKCTGRLCSTFDEASQREVLLCHSASRSPSHLRSRPTELSGV